MYNLLQIVFNPVDCNGFPRIRVALDNDLICDVEINPSNQTVEVPVSKSVGRRILTVERYGKTNDNCNGDQDQTLEIVNIKIDNASLPKFLINSNSRFEFNDQCHPGSCFFGPNGTWTFEFETPMLTYVLDQRIVHEAKYSQDYVFPWSYKFGPNSVADLTEKLLSAQKKIQDIYG